MPLPPRIIPTGTYLDLLAIMSDAPESAHRGAAAVLLARELVARMDLSNFDYRGPNPSRQGLHFAEIDAARVPTIPSEDPDEDPRPAHVHELLAMPRVDYPSSGPRAARRYLWPLYGGAVQRGAPAEPRFALADIVADAAMLRGLAVGLMGSDAFAESRSTFETMMAGAITSGDFTRVNLGGGAHPSGTLHDGEPVDPRFKLELRNLPLSGGYELDDQHSLRVPSPGNYRVQVDGLARAPDSNEPDTEITIAISGGITSTTHTFVRSSAADVWFEAEEPADAVITVADVITIQNASPVAPKHFALLGALLRVAPE